MAPINRKFRTTHSPGNRVKTAILLDLHALKQERKSRLQTVLGRFLECQELQMSGPGGKSRRTMLTMASGETPLATRRISAAGKLMAARCGIGLTSLANVPP